MYCSRPVVRSPAVLRNVRNASFFPSLLHGYHPRSVPVANEFAPFFKVFEELTTPSPSFLWQTRQGLEHGISSEPSFNARFDVREVGSNYELRGEVPGFESSDIEVEFTDPRTLVIRGRAESTKAKGPAESEAPESTENAHITSAEPAKDADNDSLYSTGSYQKPSVEEDDAAEASTAVAADAGKAPASAAEESTQQQPSQAQVSTKATAEQQQDSSVYWFRERRTGSFQRTFRFESGIDQSGVTAKLRNGVLDITIPKLVASTKRINIE